ncbi:MAG: MOSC N-terminal beta barrel domain-containing protein [Moraxellaceae bacterium]|nr:MOSC N-terminal beta barrel domain-containing protein [Moraxellaceae bacterium]
MPIFHNLPFIPQSRRHIALTQSVLSSFGLQHDRRWLLVDDEGKFITQRQYAQMALIHVQ